MTRARDNPSISILKQAFAEQRLTLFLGAGISVANGLPTWERLVLSLYFATIGEQEMDGWRPFSNYLYAISEWYLLHSGEPPEITARKVKSFYERTEAGETAFREAIREAIYGVKTKLSPQSLLAGNPTLHSIVKLCSTKRKGRFGVRSVITYNYDNLLGMALADERPVKAVYSKSADFDGHMPIFHVHGYVPYDSRQLDPAGNSIIFTEEQYNVVASDPYSWSNLVQLREMSGSVGVMIGLSLSDRNIRRLLDAICQSPIKPKIFALLKSPDRRAVPDADADSIHQRAIDILGLFRNSGIKREQDSGIKSERNVPETETGFTRGRKPAPGIKKPSVKSSAAIGKKSRIAQKKGPVYRYEIRGIIEQVERLEQRQHENVLRQLGIVPIWYKNHSEIPSILGSIC